MFSLLRRTKNKKARDQFNDAPKNSANQQNNASTTKAAATMAATGARTFERYRQFSDSESEAGLTAITVRKPHIRAPIEEFEDLRDLENNEGDDDDYDDNDAGEDEAVLPTSSASFGDDDKIYFERNRKNDRLCEEEEKVNLAKTAANFRPNEAEEEAEATATTSAVRDRTSNLKSNSAIKTNNHQAFALSKFDGDRGDAVYFADIQRKTSQNEQAEWQGHVSSTTSGNRKIIDKSIECNSSECFFSPSLLYSSKQFNNSVPTTTTTTTTTKTATAAISTAKDAERSVIADTTTRDTKSNSATADDTVINQVKYRNLGNSHTVKNKKNSEAKRQSRLSLTFGGLGLTTHGKGKSAAETTTTTTDSKQVKKSSVVPSALRKSFFHNKTKSIDNDQEVIGKNEHKERQNSKLNSQDAIAIKSEETDKKLGPIQKSREFFSDIFMARGRNHNRNRNQMQQQNQPQQQQQLQSQQQQLQPPQEPSSHQSSSNQQQPQSLESCKHATVSSGGSNNHNNNHFNSTMNINQNDNNAWRNWSSLHSTHLETISDPSSVSTNSYQMTMSNNSPKNFSQIKVDDNDNDDDERQQRSNSAEHNHNSREEHSSAEYSREQRRARSLSQDYHKAGANKTNSARNNQEPVSPPLNNANDEGQYFIHAANTEKNGADTADTAEEQNSHQDQQRELEAAININKRREKIPTNLEGAIRDGCSSAKRPFNELTECDRDSLLHSAALPNAKSRIDERDAYDLSNDNDTVALLMGQTSGKPETPSNTRASTPREFRESKIPESQEFGRVGDISENNVGEQSKGIVPTITVVDYSDGDGSGSSSGLGSPVEQEVFYDFENARHDKRDSDGVNITNIEDDDEQDDGIEDDNDTDDDDEENVFHEQQQQQQQAAPSVYQQKWPRQNRTILENVIEQEEEDDIEGADNAANLDHEQCSSSHFDSPERNPLKSGNTSDSNLSTSFPDSGIGDSLASSSSTHSAKHFRDNDIGAVDSSATSVRFASLHLQQQRLPFVRDGNSTDCDDTLMQFDDLDYVAEGDVGSTNPNERLVCIESISLPDVVVESTTGTSGSNSSASLFTGGLSSSSSSAAGGEHIVNINGATGNSMGSVHFIPIHVEGGDNGSSQKRRSVDDSVIGGNKNFAHMNGHHSKPTIEIIEDASELNISRSKSFSSTDDTSEKLKRELFEQKSRFSVQLEDAEKNVHNLQTKVNDMQTKIDKLEQELSTKAWNVERLQGELSAAQRDDEYVRKKLKLLEDEKTLLRHKYSENEDELKIKYEDLDTQYMDLQEKYKLTQKLACNLQTQLAVAQSEAESWRNEVDKIREELEEQTRILKNALDNSEAERRICEDKWQKEFEMLRTQNLETEETLMTDCEWQLRQMQKQCKDKVDKSQHGRLEALEKAEMLENELQERRKEVNDLKVYQAEVKSLRGVVSEQENSIQSLMDQIENLKADLEEANENLEEQIEAVKKIKYQCDNAIYDKERQMIYRIDEVRNEAAAFWEDKLYTEMTRLKNELESVYVDERRDALDKLQAEHIEELRALTTRYTANEEELRVELADLQDRFDNKNEEFLELREKSDNALLQTRMHLDRADREFQTAMFREEERREALEESLRKEFEEEKEEMEEKFCERLGHVKEEFARELQISTQELTDQHKKDLEQYKVKLQTERDEALQELAERHRQKLAAAEEKRKDIELRQQRDLKDLKAAYDAEKTALDKRDISNANEIEQLHRKCRCLTNLFEEMRMRYERRDPRPEDLLEIAELRSRCESQERDLYLLTDRLRDMQIQMSELQRNNECTNTSNKNKSNKQIKKPPPKTIPTNCDVIYEENEERDSPPPPLPSTLQNEADGDEDDDDDADEQEEDVSEDESSPPGPVIELNNKIGKTVDRISEDESHMISAV